MPQNKQDMKKLFAATILATLLSCNSKSSQTESNVVREPVIERTCMELMSDTLTLEEAAHWDSLNADGSRFLLIRRAERDLDTIINHYHVVFSTQP